MPANKNALIRYKTIDNCLRNRYRSWTLEDLVEAHHPFRQRARPEGNPPTEPLVQLYRTQADAAHHVPVVLGKTTI